MYSFNRLKRLVSNSSCPIKKKPYLRLEEEELQFIFKFLEINNRLNDEDFKAKAHGLFLDWRDKPKHYVEIIEVLMMTCH